MTPAERINYIILGNIQTYVFIFFTYYLYTQNETVWMWIFVFMSFLSILTTGARLTEWYGKVRFEKGE